VKGNQEENEAAVTEGKQWNQWGRVDGPWSNPQARQ